MRLDYVHEKKNCKKKKENSGLGLNSTCTVRGKDGTWS